MSARFLDKMSPLARTQLSEKYFHGLDPSARHLDDDLKSEDAENRVRGGARPVAHALAREQISSTAMATIASMMTVPNAVDLASLSHLRTMRSSRGSVCASSGSMASSLAKKYDKFSSGRPPRLIQGRQEPFALFRSGRVPHDSRHLLLVLVATHRQANIADVITEMKSESTTKAVKTVKVKKKTVALIGAAAGAWHSARSSSPERCGHGRADPAWYTRPLVAVAAEVVDAVDVGPPRASRPGRA